MKELEYWIWSNEHCAWWKANHNGYTEDKKEAGRYSFDEACKIVMKANQYQKKTELMPNEAMVPIQSYCCASPMVDGVQCLNCGGNGL